jgi:hypothetical protein
MKRQSYSGADQHRQIDARLSHIIELQIQIV